MPIVKRILTASSGAVAYAVFQALLIRIMARDGGVNDVGLFLLAQAIATPVALLAGLRLKDQLATSSHDGEFRGYLPRLGLATGTCFLIVAAGWTVFGNVDQRSVGVSVLLANLAQSFVWASQGTFIRNGQLAAVNGLDFALGFGAVGSAAFGYSLGNGLVHTAYALATTWSAIALGAVLVTSTGAIRTPSTTFANDLTMGFGAMGAVGQITAARLGTAAFLGSESLARIGTSSFLVRASVPLVGGALRVLSPALAAAHREGPAAVIAIEGRVLRSLRRSVGVAVVAFGLLGYFIGAELISLLFDEAVTPSAITVMAIAASAPFLYGSMILAQLLVARRDSVAVSRMTMSALVVTAVLIWPLSELWGETGAAVALGVGYFTRLVAALRELRSAEI